MTTRGTFTVTTRQRKAERLAGAIHRAEAMHGPVRAFGFGELERFHAGPPALDALRFVKLHTPALDRALKIYGLRVRAWSARGVTIERVEP